MGGEKQQRNCRIILIKENSMKIFQIITLSELGGAQSVVLNIANNLANKHQIFVIAGGDGPMWKQLDKRVKHVKINILKRSISPIDFFVLIYLLWLRIKYKPDIVHLHSSKIGILGRLAFAKSKIIYTIHGFDSIRVAYRKFLPIEKFLKNRVKAIVAVSNYDRNNLLSENIKRNVYTIYNGIYSIILNNSMKLYVPENKKTILTIARIEPPKKYTLFENVAKLLPQYNFVWIGNKTYPPNPPENVFCMGEIPNAAQYYTLADLCLLPSNYEGLPMTIIEAMSVAKPVVASNVGGISEIVRYGINGYCLENNAELFAEKIVEILENENLFEKMSQKSKQTFEEILTVEKMVKQYLKIYQA